MPVRVLSRLALAVALVAAASAAACADDELRAWVLAAACMGCHGSDGAGSGAIPPLAGNSERFLRQALDEYKSGASTGTVMNRIARGYSDEELARIAAWYAQRPAERSAERR